MFPLARRLVIGVTISLVAVLAPASAVQADQLVDWKCQTVNWWGSILPTLPPTMADDRSSGTLKHCITVTKKSDINPNYNFYEIRMEDDWNISNNGGYSHNHAYGHVASTPSVTEYKATPSILSDHTCHDPLFFSFSYMGFGVGIQPEICFDTWLNRTYQSYGIVHWDTANVLKTAKWDQVYFVKVPQSSRPKFTAAMHYPWYTIQYDYAWGGWRNYEVQKLVSLSVQTT